MDAIVAAEHPVHNPSVVIVEAVGYAAGSDVPVAQKVYSTAGTLTGVSLSAVAPGEAAALVRYSTAARTTKNHPIYLFNYYHHCLTLAGGAAQDTLDTNERTALATYAAAWIAGFSDGAITATRCSPNSAAATGSIVDEYVTHRDFPYSRSV